MDRKLTPSEQTQAGRGCSSVSGASDRHSADAGSIPRCGKGFVSPDQVSVQTCGVRTPPYAIVWIKICAHDKGPVVHVRVRWIMATQTRPASPWVTEIISLMIVVAQRNEHATAARIYSFSIKCHHHQNPIVGYFCALKYMELTGEEIINVKYFDCNKHMI